MANPVVHAQRNMYQSGSGGPFIRMMLTMMDAMGMIDKMPNNGLYGNNQMSPWSNVSNPYTRALAMRGIYPGASSLYSSPYSNNMLGNNPFARSPWLQTPWLDSGEYGRYGSPYASPLWGTPDWGVLPAEKYSPYGYSSYGEQWSDSDLEGWVDEPWETSEWNPKAEKSEAPVQAQSYQQPQASQRTQSPQPNVPVVQNFNITVPDNTQLDGNQGNSSGKSQGKRQGNGYNNEYNRGYPDAASNRSPLARLAQQGPSAQRSNRPRLRSRENLRHCVKEPCNRQGHSNTRARAVPTRATTAMGITASGGAAVVQLATVTISASTTRISTAQESDQGETLYHRVLWFKETELEWFMGC